MRQTVAVIWCFSSMLAGGLFYPRLAICFPWSTDMFHGQFVRPMERTPRNQPAGTLTQGGIPPMTQEAAAAQLKNPLLPSPQVLSRGKFLFLTNCAPCHDSKGTGEGPVVIVLEKKPKNLTVGEPVKLNDGALFATIRGGFKAMPSYGDTLTTNEAWELVAFVRYLQAQAH